LFTNFSSGIQTIRLFYYLGYGLSLSFKRYFTAKLIKAFGSIDTDVRGITNAGLTLLGSLCGIYDAGVNECGVHDGLMQYDAIF
jgi:hypothetical protein